MRKTGKKVGKEQSAAGQVGFRFRGLARAAVWDSASMTLRSIAQGYSKPAIARYRALPRLSTVLHARESRSSAES
jgi:hypothetical protein